MKRQIATCTACFFLILSSSGGESSLVREPAMRAENFLLRTRNRIARGWTGARENFHFAVQCLKDKAVTAERDAKARAKLAADDLRGQAVQKTDETLRKTRQTVRDAYSDLVTTGGELGSEALSRAKEGGEKASQTVRKRVRQGIRDVENSDW